MSYYVGIDIGGTKTRGILFDASKNKVLDKFIILTPKNKKEFLLELKNNIEKLMKGEKIKGIGVAVAGMVDENKKILLKAHNLPFLNKWNIRNFFKEFKVSVLCDNDSQCFLRAEFYLGTAKKYKNIVAMTIGTGIGGGIIIGGKFYNGRDNSAGEFGHTIVQIESRNGQSLILGDLGAKKAFLKYGNRSEVIGIGVANLINSFNPDAVVLGGGGIVSGKVDLTKVKKIAKRYVKSPPVVNTPIVKTKFGDLAQAIGAALLFKEK